MKASVLNIENLEVFYEKSHILQNSHLSFPQECLALVGRNGMGKTTLCETIMGFKRARSGSVLFKGKEILGMPPHEIVKLGISYVPQGRGIWPSLTVEAHLKIATRRRAKFKIDSIYELFPRLHERRKNFGNELSGGEQQLLAISRALLTGNKLMIMDEPTEGLAPVMIEQLKLLLERLVNEEKLSIFLVEQNLNFALSVSSQICVMSNGQISNPESSENCRKNRDSIESKLGIYRQTFGTWCIDCELRL